MYQMPISTNKVSSEMLRPKKFEIPTNCERAEKTKCHEIEPNPSKDRAMHEGDNLSFWDEFVKFTSIHIHIFKQVPKYLATGL
jgi:hypothetical protein